MKMDIYGVGVQMVVEKYGDGTTNNYLSPKQINDQSYQAVSCGYSHTLALDSEGYLWSWGDNGQGQLRRWNLNNKANLAKSS